MNKLICFISCLCIGTTALADDTEIYGATAIDEDSRVNSNVLFIMDTSGSMGGEVDITPNPFVPSATYSGDYNSDDVYNNLYDDGNDGHNFSSLTDSDSTDCSDEVTTLSSEGRVLGNFKQWRSNRWKNLSDGNDGVIRCDYGRDLWLYTGNYLNWYHNSSNATTSTRLEVVVDVVKNLTESLTDINLGLMRFDRYSDGGMIDVPVTDIATSGLQIRNKLDTYIASGGTPLEETMYEAGRYYRGEEWTFGNDSYPNSSVSESRQGAASSDYQSPIEASCQKNHIILLTDGEPTSDTSANGLVKSLIASTTLPSGLSQSCSGNGDCMDELAYWLKNKDHSTSQAGNQEITTYTIGGFGLVNGVELLKRTADFGGGRYFAADDTSELTEALEAIFLDILSTDSTFTAPAVSVNAFNASEHRDDLFYALFRPDENIKWAGNLKKYRLTEAGLVEGKEVGVPAISEATGFFNESISDFWNATEIPDGKKVDEGGMANLLEPSNRKVWTNTDDTTTRMVSFGDSNGATATSFGVSDAEFTNLYDWSRGVDVDDNNGDGDSTDSRYSVGDPLHSEPVIVTYGGDAETPDSTIFFGTNEGFIHAIDTTSGIEEFAFIPRSLHSTQKTYYDNNAAAADKPYGMDGQITTWFKDVNENNILEGVGANPDDEHVYLYAGMRRGGRNYYGLNISDRSAPKMLFEIKGGQGSFSELGQTWSGMTVARVKFNNVDRDVLIFGGGYDENQDVDEPGADSMGRAIYFVDATTGDRLAWIGGTGSGADLELDDMVNSIPASISAIDISGDGLIDYLFATDTGGRIFRIDLNVDSKFLKGGMIASLADLTEDDNAGRRRFYNKPNVALVKDKENGDHLTISVGSGHRAHPILTTAVKNRFYVIKDENVAKVSASHTYSSVTNEATGVTEIGSTVAAITAAAQKVFNATPLMKGDFDAETTSGRESIAKMKTMLTAGGGWYITFDTEGEKVLAESTTFAGAVIFTTFSKSGTSSSTCGPDTGTSRLYVLDQKWAEAAVDLDGDGDTDADDAAKILAHSGIAPRPVIIYREGGSKTIAIGTETIDDSRFNKDEASDEACTENCEKVVSECEASNCNVTPLYWRQ